jgi:hypothetical protein
MANTTISNLTAATTLTGAEIVPVVQSSSTVRTTTANIAAVSNTPVTLAYAAEITPASSGRITYRVTMTGDMIINAPSGAADGNQIEFWLTASGGARTVTFSSSWARIPSSSTLTSPVTIASGTQGELMFRYDSVLGAWKAARFVNGYTV